MADHSHLDHVFHRVFDWTQRQIVGSFALRLEKLAQEIFTSAYELV